MRSPRVVASVLALALTGGCGILASASPPARTPAARSGLGPAEDHIPFPCTLLSRAEVTQLTGREVTGVDEDPAYCQWNQADGQLAVFLTRTTRADFEVVTTDAREISGLGEDAYWNDNHLYVLAGTTQIDVYSHGDDEDTNLEVSKQVATVLLTRV
ncbi:DUF3558 domain-containing protein [Actinoplanes bogorensis]|uniref:DUF3558 domain-containing protein n=1 Tax=Paractinoplanes bogorensis TaxID=1610840 RepID=A0ABS5YMD5_9ACTN|nr:DUF3558 domain-containing protein [Actinoplanes bogorensis]MBU2664538.1 DUF3558 domain-containing protein [Actinoplanes bogorensis]